LVGANTVYTPKKLTKIIRFLGVELWWSFDLSSSLATYS